MVRPVLVARFPTKYILIRYRKLRYPLSALEVLDITTFTVLSTVAFFVKYWNQKQKFKSSKCIQCLMWKTKREKKKIADLIFAWHIYYIDMSISGVKIIIFWDMIPCNLLDMNQHYRGTCYLHLQVPWSMFINPSRTNLKKTGYDNGEY